MFEEALNDYCRSLAKYLCTCDVPTALKRLEKTRQHLATLPSPRTIDRHFRIEQAEAKVLQKHRSITETAISGSSHD